MVKQKQSGKLRQAVRPRLDPEDREPVSESDLEGAFAWLASASARKLRSENREPTQEELNRRYRLMRR